MPHPDPLSQARAGVYDWLSWSLGREFDQAGLVSLSSPQTHQWMSGLARVPGLAEPVAALRQALDRAHGREEAQLELAADYASLFLVAPPQGVPLTGGHYPGKDPAGERLALRKWLVEYGYAPRENIPVDHLAIQLALMARCIEATAPVTAQQGLLQQHLLPCLAPITAGVRQRQPEGVYAALLTLARVFVQQDADYLASERKQHRDHQD